MPRIYTVAITPSDNRGLDPIYEIISEDFVFQRDDQAFLLHFGMSD
jgi:hypothetical protein